MRTLALTAFILCTLAATVAKAELINAYEILRDYHNAIGGLEQLKSEKTIHFAGTFLLAGLEGTMEYWGESPDKSRMELDLGIFAQTQGDNGEFPWSVDQNGKLQIERGEAALKRREVEILRRSQEHRDPESSFFEATFEGTEMVDDIECYVIRTTNTINEDFTLEYFNTKNLLMEKSISATPDGEMHVRYFDYREVEGVLHPFREEIQMLPIGQEQILELDTFEVNVEIDPVLFEPPEDDVRDFRFVDGGTSVEVPFELIERHLFLGVTMDCETSLWVLDTGASMSVMDSGLVAKLGLTTEGNMKGQGAGNAVDVTFVEMPPFSAPGVEFDSQKAAVIDIASLFRQTSGMEIGGILGYDFLSRFVTRVDYANEMLTLYDPESFEYEGDGVLLDAPLRGGTFTVPVTVDGEHGGLWSVDLGAGGSSFHYPYARDHGLLERGGIDAVGFGAGGRMARRVSLFETVEMAGFSLDDPRLSVPAGETVGAFGSGEITGNLGNTLFRNFVLTLDYERQQMIVEKGENFGYDFPEDKSGLQIWMPEDDLEVLHVASGTPADEAGFEMGDLITTVNDIGVDHLDGIMALRELLREEKGTEYRFGLLRDGRTMKLTLTLDDLF